MLQHSYPQVPSLAEWKKDSAVGTALWPRRADDKALAWIDGLVNAIAQAGKGEERAYLLAELFFATLWWSNNYKSNSKMDARRRPAILSLNLCAANQVAKVFGCGVGGVASALKSFYGTGLSEHGIRTDITEGTALKYLSVAQRERLRVLFRGGLAYRLVPDGDTASLELVDTSGDSTSGWEQRMENGKRIKVPTTRPGQGFVMSVSGALYLARLGERALSYHSTFMAGEAVLCAGTMEVKCGQITRIKNDSGHYQPIDTALAQVLRRLQFYGVNTARIRVEVERDDKAKAVSGDQFLRVNGNWSQIPQLIRDMQYAQGPKLH